MVNDTTSFGTLRRSATSRREGYAVVLVLGAIAMTLAVCYSMLRVQATSLQIANNASRESAARQAALAGMSLAMRQMHGASWSGADSTFSEQINSTDSFSVTFATGDSALTSTDADHPWWPYRVTVTSTGYSIDPSTPAIVATHQVTAVLQLVPRAFSAEPAGWTTMNDYTVYQWDEVEVTLQLPLHIDGPVRTQGPVELCPDYPFDEMPFHGAIDDVVIFDRALSSAEVATLASRGFSTPNDLFGGLLSFYNPAHWWRMNESANATSVSDSKGGNTGTLAGASAGVAGPAFMPNNKAVWFNGASDHIDLGNFDLASGGTTIGAWIKIDSFANEKGRIISKASGDTESDHYFALATDQDRLSFSLKIDGDTETLIASDGTLSAGQWTFAVATYDGVSMKIYKDGALVGTNDKAGVITAAPTVPVFIGDNPPGGSRGQYLRDLKSVAAAGNDFRPLNSTVDFVTADSSFSTLAMMNGPLGASINDIGNSNSTPLSFPTIPATYQLYPGGRTYVTQSINASTYSNVTYVPDIETNPLGICYHTNDVELEDNIDFEGTLVSKAGGELKFRGANIKMQPAWMPQLDGTSGASHLPTAIVNNKVFVEKNAEVELHGITVTWGEFEIEQSNGTTHCNIQGRVFTDMLKLPKHDGWDKGQEWYRAQLWAFRAQREAGGIGAISHFPQWLEQQHAFEAEPKIKIQAPASDIRYHWQDWDEPIYAVHASDSGLRWQLIRWSTAP